MAKWSKEDDYEPEDPPRIWRGTREGECYVEGDSLLRLLENVSKYIDSVPDLMTATIGNDGAGNVGFNPLWRGGHWRIDVHYRRKVRVY